MKKVLALSLTVIMLLASVVTAFAEDDAVDVPMLISSNPNAQPFTATTMEGAALECIEKAEAAYTYTDWNTVANTVDLYTITVPAGTQYVKLSFDSEKLCYNYAFTGEGAPSVTDANYLSGAVKDENTQDGKVCFTVPLDSQLVNYDGSTAPADGVIDYVQIQTPYDADWNTTVLYAVSFKLDGEAETSVETAFSDVPADAAYAAAVNWAYANGVTAGVGKGKFGVGLTVTRAQLVTFVWNCAGKPEVKCAAETVFYNDIKAGDYFAKAIGWAYSVGVIDGVEPHTFGANQAVDREEIVRFLANCWDKTPEELGALVPAGNKREDLIVAIYNQFK